MIAHTPIEEQETTIEMRAKPVFVIPTWTVLKHQIRQIWPIFFATLGLALLVLASMVIMSLVSGTALSKLTRDVVTVAKLRFYIGFLSTLGLMLWAATAAICWFGWLILRQIQTAGDQTTRPESDLDLNLDPQSLLASAKSFLLASGLFSFVLLFDDAYLLHESFFPKYLRVPEGIVFAGYLCLFGAYFLYFYRAILKTNYLLLLAATGCLGLSMVVDEALAMSNWVTFIEDSLKFMGIAFWLVYFAQTTLEYIKPVMLISDEVIEQGFNFSAR